MKIESKYEVNHPEKGFDYVYFMYENKICSGRIKTITSTTTWDDYRDMSPKTKFEYNILHIKDRITLPEYKLYSSKEELIKSL